MHRVELKDHYTFASLTIIFSVPNAPCGVESLFGLVVFLEKLYQFLMHRVELKEEDWQDFLSKLASS